MDKDKLIIELFELWKSLKVGEELWANDEFLENYDRMEKRVLNLPVVGCSEPNLGTLTGLIANGKHYKYNEELNALIDDEGNIYE